MNYTITPSIDEKYVILTVKGEIERKTALQLNKKAHVLGKSLNINRYLMDVTEARNIDSIMDSHNFAYKDIRKTNEIDKTARVALLVSQNDQSHDFIVTVTKNSGLNVTKFTNKDFAISFLLQ